MPIKCQECGQEFARLITSTHLKRHGMTTAQYRTKHGDDSLASPEYRAERSAANSGKNNPNHGKNWTDEQKAALSSKKKGTEPWNKGIKLEDTTAYREAAQRREARYQRGELKRNTVSWSQADRERISRQVREYAQNNPEKMKQRGRKAQQTLRSCGHYERKRAQAVQKDIDTFVGYGFEAEHVENRVYHLTCRECHTEFTRGSGQWHDRMCPGCGRENSTSDLENQVYRAVKNIVGDQHTVFQSDRTLMNPFEIDILIPSLKMGIEVNGIYWHSEEGGGKSRWYHRTKLTRMRELGYTLIQIFEDEWLNQRDIVISRLRHKLGFSQNKIYARHCEVREITAQQAFDFFAKNHLQGRGYGSHFWGLYHDDTLVAGMSFARLNRAKGFKCSDKNVFELNRYASSVPVVGGASRLFSSFLRSDVDIATVLSYSDLRWNDGGLYESLGFEYDGDTVPGYWYVQGAKRIHRYQLRKQPHEPRDRTEQELRREQGYLRLWDCGHTRWKWTKKRGPAS